MENISHNVDYLQKRVAELEQQVHFYKLIADNTYDWEIYRDLQWNLLYVSPAFESITGYTCAELFAGTITEKDYVHPHDWENVLSAIISIRQNHILSDLEFRIIRKDKDVRTVNLCGKLVYENLVCTGIRLSIRDITIQKNFTNLYETRKVIAENEKKYKQIFDSSPIGIFQRKCNGDYEYMNKALIQTMGFNTLQEAIDFYADSEKMALYNDAYSLFNEILLRDKMVSGYEMKLISIDGKPKYFSIYAYLVDDDTKINGFVIDITERKLATIALLESETKVRAISNNFTQGVIYQVQALPNGTRKFTYLSDSVTRYYGITPEQGTTDASLIYKRIYPDDIPKLIKAEKKSLDELSMFKMETRVINPDNTIRWSMLVSTPRKLDNGIVSWDGIEFDITDRKQSELALQESETLYRFISDNINDVIWIYSLRTSKFLYISPAVERMRGYTVEEACKQSWKEILTPESFEHSQRVLSDGLLKRTPENTFSYVAINEFEQYRKDGSVFPVEVSTTVVFDDDGKPKEIIGVTRDISARKHAERRIVESESRYRNLFENANDAIFIIKDYMVVECNSLTEKLFGGSKNEILFKKPSDLSPQYQPDGILSSEKALSLMNIVFEGKPQRFEWLHSKFDGSLFITEVSLNLLDTKGEPCILAIVRDITEKKERELELQKYRETLEAMVLERTEELASANEELSVTNEELYIQRDELESTLSQLKEAQQKLIQTEKMASLGVLSAGIAHEINNPLNFISGGLMGIESLVEDELIPKSERLDMIMYAINEGVRRASNIVTGLSHYCRNDELPFAICNMHSIIDNCLTIMQSVLKHKIEIVKDYSCLNYSVLGNEGKLHQVVLNIIGNAAQAIEKQGTICITTKNEANNFLLYIVDSGCGIDAVTLSKIFDPFFTTKPSGEGTGLGLSISQNIIIEHKGTIKFESQLGKGTTAIITLPLHIL